MISQECQIEEISDEEDSPKSSKDKKSNGPDTGPSLTFKLTNKVPYKTVLKGLESSCLVYSFYLSDQVLVVD